MSTQLRNVIFLHKNKLERELFTLDWESRFNVQVFATSHESLALNKLKDESSYLDIYSPEGVEIQSEKNLPVFIFDELQNSFKLSFEFQSFLKKNYDIFFITKLGENVDKSFELSGIDQTTDAYLDYLKIRIQYLENIEVSPVHFYIKVGMNKFIKVINKNEGDLRDITHHYQAKGMKFLYVKSCDHKELVAGVGDLLEKTTRAINSDPQIIQQNIVNYIENTNQSLMGLGIKGGQVQIVQKTVDIVLSEAMKIETLWSIVQDTLTRENYLTGHSMAVAFICCSISTKIPVMNNDSIRKKLVLAALFHDSFLEEGRLLYMTNIQLCADKNLTSREKRQLAFHTLEASHLMRKIPNIPPNVDNIIFDHHFIPEGKTFFEQVSSSAINQLTAIFILAEDFYHLCFQHGMNVDAKYFAIKSLRKHYNFDNFKIPLDVLENLFTQEADQND